MPDQPKEVQASTRRGLLRARGGSVVQRRTERTGGPQRCRARAGADPGHADEPMDQLALAGQFGGHARLGEAFRVGLALVAQRIEAGDDDVGGREARSGRAPAAATPAGRAPRGVGDVVVLVAVDLLLGEEEAASNSRRDGVPGHVGRGIDQQWNAGAGRRRAGRSTGRPRCWRRRCRRRPRCGPGRGPSPRRVRPRNPKPPGASSSAAGNGCSGARR